MGTNLLGLVHDFVNHMDHGVLDLLSKVANFMSNLNDRNNTHEKA